MSSKGQCLISCAPLRAEPRSGSEMVSQVLFGELFQIIEAKGDWVRVQLDMDGYQGWMSSDQVSEISFKSVNVQSKSPYEIKDGMHLPLGCLIPENFLQTETEGPLDLALKMLGSPYLWGGKTFMGIDCSGLMQVIHLPTGIRLPRDSSQQVKIGEEVTFDNRQAGDLAFFQNEKGQIMHVGIITKDLTIIHASGCVREDVLTNSGILRSDGKQTHRLAAIRRI